MDPAQQYRLIISGIEEIELRKELAADQEVAAR